jgi:hypothetical protein
MAVDAVARDLFAGWEPHTGQGFHPGDQPIEHRNAQRAAGLEGVHADVEIAARVVLLAERGPPDIKDPLRVGDPLCRWVAAEPVEVEIHRVVDDIVHWQINEAVASALVELVMRPLVRRPFGAVDIPVLAQQRGVMAAARAGWTAAGDPFERGDGLGQVILFERRLLRYPVLPHVIGDLVAALDNRTQRPRVEFADSPRRKDCCLDTLRIEQLDEPPDADPPTELAFRKLHWGLIEQPAQQHRVKIAGEVDRNADAFWPGQVWDELVAGGIGFCHAPQFRELLVEVCRRHRAHFNISGGSSSIGSGLPRWRLLLGQEGSGARHCEGLDWLRL